MVMMVCTGTPGDQRLEGTGEMHERLLRKGALQQSSRFAASFTLPGLAGLGRQAIGDVTPQHQHRDKTATDQRRGETQQYRAAQLVDDLPAEE